MKLAHLALGLVAIAACGEAGGDVKGGDVTDAGREATNPSPFTPDGGDLVVKAGECAGSGSKWSDLYRDVFGPTGRPGSCSFQSNCHGSATGDGARSPSGIHCFDEKTCRASILERGLVQSTDQTNPEGSVLLAGLLRRIAPDGTVNGFMPQQPTTFAFPETCIDRMKVWIANGTPDD